MTATHPAPRVVLELLKPITWFAPMWAFGCGLASARGAAPAAAVVVTGFLLTGPLVCGASQAVNDWFDRHVDAINEPDRPIPSGRMPGTWGLTIAVGWTLLSLATSQVLGPFGCLATCIGLALAWAYSAPPFRLKRNGWWGNAAVGLCYEGLPWVTGAVVAGGGMPTVEVFAFAGLYSLGAHGIMTLNDFKSIEGDRRSGIASLPAQLGADGAARVACVAMAMPQIFVVALLWHWDFQGHALAVALLLAVQLGLMVPLLADPRGKAPWYNATGTTLYVLGMLVSAFAVRNLA